MLIAGIVISYLVGSIPFGLLLGFAAGKDVRQEGSKNIGMTNVWRVCGR
ncbi:MAG: glycerol-3-phosphate acyltransferase, partial [Planctomycetota bacterium]|nr:glycerol-3-phosphate acyltransferase [Planctomycetota bacterium]